MVWWSILFLTKNKKKKKSTIWFILFSLERDLLVKFDENPTDLCLWTLCLSCGREKAPAKQQNPSTAFLYGSSQVTAQGALLSFGPCQDWYPIVVRLTAGKEHWRPQTFAGLMQNSDQPLTEAQQVLNCEARWQGKSMAASKGAGRDCGTESKETEAEEILVGKELKMAKVLAMDLLLPGQQQPSRSLKLVL